MKIAIFSLTRDRLLYTQQCFKSLRQNAGMPFDHYVFDNGSEDGTVEWLSNEYRESRSRWWIMSGGFNQGISKASNHCLREILQGDYDLILKADNDAFIRTPNIIPQICDVMADAGNNYILSPRVEGINRQPRRYQNTTLAGHPIGLTPIVGGLFHVVPAAVYRAYMEQGGYPETLPLAKGQDDHLCHWFITQRGGRCGYIEDLVVEHHRGTDQQAKDYPDYFRRKWDIEEVQR
jgi:glycosyltransferase involved in cell wall biosynthesis